MRPIQIQIQILIQTQIQVRWPFLGVRAATTKRASQRLQSIPKPNWFGANIKTTEHTNRGAPKLNLTSQEKATRIGPLHDRHEPARAVCFPAGLFVRLNAGSFVWASARLGLASEASISRLVSFWFALCGDFCSGWRLHSLGLVGRQFLRPTDFEPTSVGSARSPAL